MLFLNMIVKRQKLYSRLEQREFGIHKAANKAAKRVFMAGEAVKYYNIGWKPKPEQVLRGARKNLFSPVFEEDLATPKLKSVNDVINLKSQLWGNAKNNALINPTSQNIAEAKISKNASFPHKIIPNGYYHDAVYDDPQYITNRAKLISRRRRITNQ